MLTSILTQALDHQIACTGTIDNLPALISLDLLYHCMISIPVTLPYFVNVQGFAESLQLSSAKN